MPQILSHIFRKIKNAACKLTKFRKCAVIFRTFSFCFPTFILVLLNMLCHSLFLLFHIAVLDSLYFAYFLSVAIWEVFFLMSRFLVSRKLAEEDYRTEHNNNMPLNLEKPINLEMRGPDSRRHSITDRDSGMGHQLSIAYLFLQNIYSG